MSSLTTHSQESQQMSTLVIEHQVADFQTWKNAFDSDPIDRVRGGVTAHTIQQPANDPTYVIVNLEFPSAEHAQQFLPALRQLWQHAGHTIGFGGADAVQTRILDDIEHV